MKKAELLAAVKELKITNTITKELFGKTISKLTVGELKSLLERGASPGVKIKASKASKAPKAPKAKASGASAGASGPVLSARILVTATPRLLVIVEPHIAAHRKWYTPLFDGFTTARMTCQNLSFERSTGTSNELNFPGMFLPILNVSKSGSLHKASSFGGWYASTARDKDPPVEVVYQYVLDKMRKQGHGDPCLVKTCIFMKELFSRFGNWEQLQISAALGGTIWDTYHVSSVLKELILTHNLFPYALKYPDARHIYQNSDVNQAYYAVIAKGKNIDIIKAANIYPAYTDRVQRNKIGGDKGWRFYRDASPGIPQKYIYPLEPPMIREPTAAKTIKITNAWLKSFNACDKEPNPEDIKDKKYVREQDLQYGEVKVRPSTLGWEDC